MVIKTRLRRCCRSSLAAAIILLLVLLLVAGGKYVTLPLRDSDRIQAVQDIISWIVDHQAVSSIKETYPDAQWMPNQKRFIVICDCVPMNVTLSNDRRVQRVASKEYESVFHKYQYDDTDYIAIKLKSESEKAIILEVSNMFGIMAGHCYKFEFRRTLWGLRASGKLLRVF